MRWLRWIRLFYLRFELLFVIWHEEWRVHSHFEIFLTQQLLLFSYYYFSFAKFVERPLMLICYVIYCDVVCHIQYSVAKSFVVFLLTQSFFGFGFGSVRLLLIYERIKGQTVCVQYAMCAHCAYFPFPIYSQFTSIRWLLYSHTNQFHYPSNSMANRIVKILVTLSHSLQLHSAFPNRYYELGPWEAPLNVRELHISFSVRLQFHIWFCNIFFYFSSAKFSITFPLCACM